MSCFQENGIVVTGEPTWSYISFCRYDYLRITFDRKIRKNYCGRKNGTKVLVPGNGALLTFFSDYYNSQARGFKILFRFIGK